jgi:hypothetical protein
MVWKSLDTIFTFLDALACKCLFMDDILMKRCKEIIIESVAFGYRIYLYNINLKLTKYSRSI